MRSNQKGNVVLILGGFLAIAAIAVAGFFLWQKSKNTAQPISVEEKRKLQPLIDTANWKTYSNNEYGYSIKIPSAWEKLGNVPSYAIDVIAPDKSVFQLDASDMRSWKSFEEYFSWLDQLRANVYEGGPSAKTIYAKNVTIDGLPAVERKEWGVAAGLYLIDTYVLRSGKIYRFSAYPYPSEATQTYYQILSTFKFLDNNSLGQTSGMCSFDKDCAPGYACQLPDCSQAQEMKIPGWQDCAITVPSCIKSL